MDRKTTYNIVLSGEALKKEKQHGLKWLETNGLTVIVLGCHYCWMNSTDRAKEMWRNNTFSQWSYL